MRKGPIEVSVTKLVAAGLLVGGVGAVIGGWTTGRFSTTGNMADWIAALSGVAAAIGTFAIGIGANRYAREAHRLNERQVSEARDRESRYFASQFRTLETWAKTMQKASRKLDQMLEMPEPFPLMGALGAITASKDVMETISFTDVAWKALEPEDADLQISCNHMVRGYCAVAGYFVDHHMKSKESLTKDTQGFTQLQFAAGELHKAAADVFLAIAKARKAQAARNAEDVQTHDGGDAN
ncbi:hypothetical protein D3C71_1167070 [compost metagenome]